MVDGWRTALDLSPADAMQRLEPFFGEFLYTHVDLEGLMRGTDMGAISALHAATSRPLTAAGGITTRKRSRNSMAWGSMRWSGWRSTPAGFHSNRFGTLHARAGPLVNRRRLALPSPAMRQRLLFLALVSILPGCSRSVGLFSEPNARAHISMLAGTIGNRPIGTAANARARAYVIDQLKLYGYEVRVQETDARRPELGRTARVANIIAVLPGKRSEALGLLSHYDSSPEAPGAADDGLGVAVSLEAARVLASRPDRTWSILVLVTDGEESGLMGAAALATDREVMTRLQAYVNVEAAGSGGPAMLFESGPANGWITTPWARRAPHPRGASFGLENLPPPAERHRLHHPGAPGDPRPELRAHRRWVLVPHRARRSRIGSRRGRSATSEKTSSPSPPPSIRSTSRDARPPAALFFDIGGITALSFSALAGWILSVAAVIAGLLACVKVVPAAVRIAGLLRWLLTTAWSVAGFAVSAAAMAGATWALRESREVYHPWYARPDRLFVLLVVVGVTAGWVMSRAGRWLPARAHGVRDPLVTWSVSLPVWLALAMLMLWFAPAAAYLWTLPLLTASILLLLVPLRSGPAVRGASVAVLAVAATLWLRETLELLRFMAALFGRLPLVTPAYVYAAVIAGAAVMLAPPFVAAVAATRPIVRPSLLTALCLFAIAVAAGFAYSAPAYTYDQPQRRVIRALQDEPDRPAQWEVASLEPGLDLAPGAPAGWMRHGDAAAASIPWGRLPHPFVFRTAGPALGAAPVAIGEFTTRPVTAGTELTLSLIPGRAGVAVSFVLPEGLVPARSSLPGAMRLGRWTATYLAPPADGLQWRASFRPGMAERLAGSPGRGDRIGLSRRLRTAAAARLDSAGACGMDDFGDVGAPARRRPAA